MPFVQFYMEADQELRGVAVGTSHLLQALDGAESGEEFSCWLRWLELVVVFPLRW